MFVSKDHHQQLLDPECYRSRAQFDDERARLLTPAWHCVALVDELPKEGSFRTLEVLGNPIVLWRKCGQVHAYLNVCAHRYCRVARESSGRADRLKCGYHGWEYDEAGNVRKIPDARSFRPLEPGMLGLKKYHAEICGRLVFVSLAERPPSLQEFLQDGYERCRSWFSDELQVAIVHERVIQANWKVLIENALESYHTAEVHPKTFGQFPDEEYCEHRLGRHATALSVSYRDEQSIRRRLDTLAHQIVGATPSHRYEHHLYYPNLMVSRLSLYVWFECVIPLTPTSSRSVVRVLCNAGKRSSWLSAVRGVFVKSWARSFLMRVGAEDAALLPDVQKGLDAVDRPMGGLISTREERIFHFQQYILDSAPAAACCQKCSDDDTLRMRDDDSSTRANESNATENSRYRNHD
jgi:choline monooxygenase